MYSKLTATATGAVHVHRGCGRPRRGHQLIGLYQKNYINLVAVSAPIHAPPVHARQPIRSLFSSAGGAGFGDMNGRVSDPTVTRPQQTGLSRAGERRDGGEEGRERRKGEGERGGGHGMDPREAPDGAEGIPRSDVGC